MNKHTEERVTFICELGCTRVREVIAALEQGVETPETAHSSAADRADILRELQAVMAVYDARDNRPC